ncbi:RnfH family protein [Pantoea sp. Aalb]|uniref:RnfH family protein n=1 Tax=Pantoea sp. Aalb TaxID=2576762 RepID=UPI00132C9AC0|nr:RnfH family protein [Pantoea sp. Aalb]MXP67236.1 RnfH family protein [Pantoea sp. Aalb]
MSNIKISIVYALTYKQYLCNLNVPIGTTVKEAIIASNFLVLHKEIDLDKNKVGIFNKLVELNSLLKNGDRVEIYRPLIRDPKEIRRQRIKRTAINNIKNKQKDSFK